MVRTRETAGRKEWVALGVLVLPLLLVSMDITVVYFGLPTISAELGATGTQQLWMADIYGFALAGMLLTMGYLGDLIGRRRLLLIGAATFALASLTAAFAVNPEMLVAARLFQGLGGATLLPSTLALVSNMFSDRSQRRTAIAIWAIGMSTGSAIGPVVGGLLLEHFWWGSIFLVNIPVLALLFVLAPVLVPEFRRPRSEVGRFDVVSSLLSLVAILTTIWSIKELAVGGVDALHLGVLVVGLALTAVFVRRQLRLEQPMIDPRLFAQRGFGPAISLGLIAFLCLIGFSLFVTQYLIVVLGLSPLVAALWTLPPPVLTMVVAPFAVIMANRGTVRPAFLVAGAFVLAALGFVCMTQVSAGRDLAFVVAGATAIGVGSAIVLTLVTDLVVAVAPPEKAGSVSALTQTFQELGGALGIALFGTVGAVVYGRLVAADIPADVPEAARQAAGRTLGAAESVAAQLGGATGDRLRAVAHLAFTSSMHVVAVVGALVAVATAVFALNRLRHVANLPEDDGDGDDREDGGVEVVAEGAGAVSADDAVRS